MSGMDSDKLGRVVLLLTSGFTPEKALQYCMTHIDMSEEEARECVEQARRRITVAADYARDEQIGIAISRINDIFTKATSAKDIKTALQAQRELNKLMDLYVKKEGSGDSGDDSEYARVIALIEKYILPLKLIDESYPIEEHVRVAAGIVRQARKKELSKG